MARPVGGGPDDMPGGTADVGVAGGDLGGAVDGAVGPTGTRTLDAAVGGTDFGRIVTDAPDTVLRPSTEDELAEAVRTARARGLPVAARGRGCSTFGQAQAARGVVIDMSGLAGVREVADGYAVAEAGASWRDVLRATLPHRLTPPVLPGYLDLSVGGTLSVGGIGGASFRYGAVVDEVAELRVVTGTGRPTTCRRDSGADLFDAVRAGLGQCGVISQARLRLVSAPARVRRYELSCPDLATLLRAQRELAAGGRFDFIEGQVEPDEFGDWRYTLVAASYYTPPSRPSDSPLPDRGGAEEVADLSYARFADRLSEPVSEFVASGEWARPHPWWTAFLPNSVTDEVVAEVMDRLRPADIGRSGAILLYPLVRERLRAPLLRVPDEPLVFLFALLRTASPDARPVSEILAANHELHELVREIGGFRYPIDAIRFTDAQWREHFGDVWNPYCTARRRYALPVVFAPGQHIPDA